MTRRQMLAGLVRAALGLAVGLTASLTALHAADAVATASRVDLEPIRAAVVAGLRRRAEAHGADVAHVLRVASCETGGTFSPWREDGSLRRGSSGELGIGQWLAGGAWYSTPGWREHRYDIRAAYESGDPEAIDWDIDALAWAFSPLAPAGFARQWSCP